MNALQRLKDNLLGIYPLKRRIDRPPGGLSKAFLKALCLRSTTDFRVLGTPQFVRVGLTTGVLRNALFTYHRRVFSSNTQNREVKIL
jgi:hypothetical protein